MNMRICSLYILYSNHVEFKWVIHSHLWPLKDLFLNIDKAELVL